MPGSTPRYSKEFKAEAVQLLRSSGRSTSQIAKEIGVSYNSLKNWLKQADIDEGKIQGLTSEEQDELCKLRREVNILRQERDFLKKAAAFFARENGIR